MAGRKQLTMGKVTRLGVWFADNLEAFKQERPNNREVAERASTALGFGVTETRIKSLRRELGTWPSKPRSQEKFYRTGEVAAIVKRMAGFIGFTLTAQEQTCLDAAITKSEKYLDTHPR